MEIVRQQLKKVMEQKGFTGMKTLSDAANLESSTVRKILNGSARSVKVETLYKLSVALGVQPVELLPKEWQKPNEISDISLLESVIKDVMAADEKNKTKSTPSQMAGDILDLYQLRINQNNQLIKDNKK